MAPTAAQLKSPTMRRIMREAAEMSKSPSPDFTAEPLESDLFEWHFTIKGPPNSVYSKGLYHGRINLPPTYPLRPPSFRFTTPNGRFEANREICLSISGHHEETWQPAWGIRTAIVALRSFMETDAKGQLGGLEMPESVRRRLAQESSSFKCAVCGRPNADIIKECEERAREAEAPSQEDAVPAELNMGWKDELEAKKAQQQQQDDAQKQGSTAAVGGDGTQSNAELAEGFVPTAMSSRQPVDAGRTTANLAPPRRAPPPVQQQPLRLAAQAVHPTNDGVPVWLDRAIVALVVLLAGLVLKILFGP